MADKTKLPEGPDFACIASRSAMDGKARHTRLKLDRDGGLQYVDLERGNRPEDALVVGMKEIYNVVPTRRERSLIRRAYLAQISILKNGNNTVKKAATIPNVKVISPAIRRILKQLAGKHDLGYDIVSQRYRRGIFGSRLVRPVDSGLSISPDAYNAIRQAADKTGISYSAMKRRYLKLGTTSQELLEQPRKRPYSQSNPIGNFSSQAALIRHIAARHGLDEGLVRGRWVKGVRGMNLIAPKEVVNTANRDDIPSGFIRPMDYFRYLANGTDLSAKLIMSRWYKGMRGSDLLKEKNIIRATRRALSDAEERTVGTISAKHGIPVDIVRSRYVSGLRGGDLIQPGLKKDISFVDTP